MDSLLELFCDVDDFCKGFLPKGQQIQLSSGLLQRRRQRSTKMKRVGSTPVRCGLAPTSTKRTAPAAQSSSPIYWSTFCNLPVQNPWNQSR